MANNSALKIAGSSLKDWVKWESGLNLKAYCDIMTQPGNWGGGIEIAGNQIILF